MSEQQTADAPPADQQQQAPPAEGEQAKQETPPEDLAELRQQIRKKGSEAAELRKRLKEAEDTLAEIKESSGTDQERAIAKAVRAARREWDAEAAKTLTRERVRSASATAGANPDDVLALLDLDGLTEQDEVDQAVADLLKQKPYLVRTGGAPKIPQGQTGQAEGQQGKAESGNDWLRSAIQQGNL